MLELKNVTKVYQTKKKKEVKALEDIDYSFQNKGFYAILGKSGSGKTTLLNLIAGLDKPSSGEIQFMGKSFKRFKGKDFDAYRNTCVGFVFQEFNLFENLNVYKNVALALELQGKQAEEQEIEEVLNRVGISDLMYRNINELSGGQKQRVAIARAIIKNPRIIIADEPTGSLDQEIAIEIFEVLKELSKEYLVILVTHNEEYAIKYAEHILRLSEGRQVEKPEGIEEKAEETLDFEYKKGLSVLSSLKMGFTNLKMSIVRLVLCIALTTMAFSCVGFSLTVSSFSLKDIILDSVVKNQYEDPFVVLKNENFIDEDFKNHINQELGFNFKGFYLYPMEYSGTGLRPSFVSDCLSLDHSSHILEVDEAYLKDLNFSIITGAFPKADDEVLITEYYYQTFLRYGFQNKEITLKPNEVTKEKIIGQTIKGISNAESSFKISGILDTGLEYSKYEHLYHYDTERNPLKHDFNLLKQIQEASYHSLIYVRQGAIQNNPELSYLLDEEYSGIIDAMPQNRNRVEEIYDYLKEQSSEDIQYYLNLGIAKEEEELHTKLLAYQYFSGIAGGIFGVFAVVLLFTLLNFTIERKKREMGVLRALGARPKNIFFIFSSEGFYVFLFSLILSYLGSSLCVILFNSKIKKDWGLIISVYHFEFLQFFILFLIAIFATVLSIFIPVLKVTRRSPAKAIRMEIK